MERIKILAIIARLIFVTESDGLTCRIDSVTIPLWNAPASVVDCLGKGRFRAFLILPDGTVVIATGRTL